MYVIRFRWAVCQFGALRNCLNLPMLRKALASLWLAYSARPLRIEEVAELLAVDVESNPRFGPEKRFPEPRDVLTICSSLVNIAVEVANDDDGDNARIEE